MDLAEINRRLEYCPDEGSPETGWFKHKLADGVAKGKWAGTIGGWGYRHIQVNGVKYHEHRMVFLIVHGYLPTKVDHKDLNVRNNHPSNLRAATHRENSCNRAKLKTNTSGYIGVSKHKASGKFAANIRVSGKAIYLGLFVDPIEAARAYDQAAKFHHKEFAVLNFKEVA